MDLRYRIKSCPQSLVIESKPTRQFMKHRQRHDWQTEAGGQLFGRLQGEDLHIVIATKPSKCDVRTRFGFKPNRRIERREIQHMHSKGLHFIGDWHTHPEPVAKPSNTDIKSIQSIYANSIHGLSYMLLIIVGQEPAPAGLYVGLHNETDCIQLRCMN